MQKLEMTRYQTDIGWAADIVGGSVWSGNWQYRPNTDASEALQCFEYKSLGGLAVLCSQRVFSPSALGRLASTRHRRIINLAIGEDARLTSTRLLAAAYLEFTEGGPDCELTDITFKGPMYKLTDDGNDTWAIPKAATIYVGGQFESKHLPHQLVEVG